VLGGGAIGCEFAQVFSRFGAQVTVVEAMDRLVANDEPEAAAVLEQAFAAEGIQVLTGAKVESVAHRDGTFVLEVEGQQLVAEKLLVAAGRRNNIADVGLESVGLDPDAPVLDTDERMRAGEKLWGIGDITGKGAFTHVSMYQAAVAVRDILGEDGPWADYRAVARVTFTEPEVASVGLTEERAREEGIAVATASGDLGARGWLAKAEGVIKLVADRDRGVLVGATVVGPAGGEIVSMLVTAVHAEVPIATLRTMHFAYPTFHRAVETVLDDLV
jgi:pyruvate/2-oxoglutarate dehydrogenase complex dihydrolipoamide dehydrogenase (E3) component